MDDPSDERVSISPAGNQVLPADAGDAAESCIGEQCPVEFDLAFFQFHHSGAPSYISCQVGAVPAARSSFPPAGEMSRDASF